LVPLGDTVTVRPVARSKPLTLVTVTVVVAVEPWFTLRLEGEAVSEKSLGDCMASDNWGRAIIAAVREVAVTRTARIMDQTGAFFPRKDVLAIAIETRAACEEC
jgi:hypothetical protein